MTKHRHEHHLHSDPPSWVAPTCQWALVLVAYLVDGEYAAGWVALANLMPAFVRALHASAEDGNAPWVKPRRVKPWEWRK